MRMRYHARHRRPLSTGRLRVATLAAALAGTAIMAPLTTVRPARADLLATPGTPSWLLTPQIAVNPAGPRPGEPIAPAVPHGYAITTDQLARYDITATSAGQQELKAFVDRQATIGIALNGADYRIYATP